MRDFFSDSEKIEPQDEVSKDEDNTFNSNEMKKLIGIEVKKAMDTFKAEWEEAHKECEESDESEETDNPNI